MTLALEHLARAACAIAERAAAAILDMGAQFVVTSCDFDIGSPAARVVNAKGVIAFSCAGAPGFGVQGVGPLAYDIGDGSPAEGAALAEYAKSKGYAKPFLVTDTGLEYSQSVGDNFKARWKALGGKLAGSDVYQNGDASAASQVTDIKQSGADVIVVASYPPGGATLLRQIRAAGIDTPMLGSQAFDGTYWLDAIPDLSNFTIPVTGSLYGDDTSKARNDFFARIKKETGKAAASANYPLAGYSSVQAIREAGTTDTKAVQAKLDAFDKQDLLIGPTTWTATCHYPAPIRPFQWIEYTKGKPADITQSTVESLALGAPC